MKREYKKNLPTAQETSNDISWAFFLFASPPLHCFHSPSSPITVLLRRLHDGPTSTNPPHIPFGRGGGCRHALCVVVVKVVDNLKITEKNLLELQKLQKQQ
jgi:hypothetical protein